MTAARGAVEQLLRSEHVDVLRESVALVVRELMEAEVAAQIGAELGERAPASRSAQRNGYRDRVWDTRVGQIELAIPKLRQGSYFPSFLQPRRRAEQALVAVVQEDEPVARRGRPVHSDHATIPRSGAGSAPGSSYAGSSPATSR
jgi:transposase-like protein